MLLLCCKGKGVKQVLNEWTNAFPTRRASDLDSAAEHADIATGGIGKDNDSTLTIVRTDLGSEIISRMISDGLIVARPGDEDPGAIALMNKRSEEHTSELQSLMRISYAVFCL